MGFFNIVGNTYYNKISQKSKKCKVRQMIMNDNHTRNGRVTLARGSGNRTRFSTGLF